MKLNDFLGYATIKTIFKIYNIDTNEIIYKGFNGGFDNLKENNLIISYFKNENDAIVVGVYEKESN